MNILGMILRAIAMALTSWLSTKALKASADEVKTQQDDEGGIRG